MIKTWSLLTVISLIRRFVYATPMSATSLWLLDKIISTICMCRLTACLTLFQPFFFFPHLQICVFFSTYNLCQQPLSASLLFCHLPSSITRTISWLVYVDGTVSIAQLGLVYPRALACTYILWLVGTFFALLFCRMGVREEKEEDICL